MKPRSARTTASSRFSGVGAEALRLRRGAAEAPRLHATTILPDVRTALSLPGSSDYVPTTTVRSIAVRCGSIEALGNSAASPPSTPYGASASSTRSSGSRVRLQSLKEDAEHYGPLLASTTARSRSSSSRASRSRHSDFHRPHGAGGGHARGDLHGDRPSPGAVLAPSTASSTMLAVDALTRRRACPRSAIRNVLEIDSDVAARQRARRGLSRQSRVGFSFYVTVAVWAGNFGSFPRCGA